MEVIETNVEGRGSSNFQRGIERSLRTENLEEIKKNLEQYFKTNNLQGIYFQIFKFSKKLMIFY